MRLAMMTPLATMRSPSSQIADERSPPIAGPMRNAIPKAAPIIPIFLVLSSGVDISETYAWITPYQAHPIPATRREKTYMINPHIPRDNPICRAMIPKRYPERLITVVNMRIFLLP
jgi:hypothetical protein